MEESQHAFSDVASFLACAAFQCRFCESKELGNNTHLQKKHLKEAIYFVHSNQEKFVVACFCKEGCKTSRSHYHCPFCKCAIIKRSTYFINHLRSIHGISADKKKAVMVNTLKRKLKDITGDAKDEVDRFACEHCTALLSTHKNLQRHIRDVHSLDTMPMICVDIRNGLYVTPKHEHSPIFPIHIVKSTNPPRIDCEEENCRKFMQIAWSSGNPGKECVHLERTKNAKQYVKPAVLTSSSLQDMLGKGLMSSEWGVKCEKLHLAAKNCEVDSVFPVSFGDKGTSKRWFFFSVFTNETDNWCQFGRTRVTFDAVAGKWNCQCKGSRKSHRCIHRMMAMWWIFQESPGTLMATSDVQAEDIDDLESHIMDGDITCAPHNQTSQTICTMTEYIYSQKRIPLLQDLPLNLRTQEETPPTTFFPSESTCPYCPEPTPTELGPPKVVTKQATVYGVSYVKKGVCVAEKQCPTCKNIVQFQEYSSGFHNFNNTVLLTLPLCELLLSGLANKTTSGRMLDTLTFFNDNRYHHQTIRRAFHHFLSLTDFRFDFACYRCGYNPPVVIADANWKLAFDIPLGTFQRPEPDSIAEKDLEVDIVTAWNDLDKSLIAEGLISGTTVANPYCKSISHSTLAPWMGEHTRAGNVLPKTECKKALKKNTDPTAHSTTKINEDMILQILDSKKYHKKDLQDACLALGVSSEGSISDLLNRLQELLNFKDVYPKLYVKLQKAGGGVLHFSCVHGIVYYVNFLFWTESARDHCDGLLSFKRFPTCYISDVAGQVARHTNNRTKQQFFQPHDGRLCAPTQENVHKANTKDLTVEMEWVKNLSSPLPQLTKENVDRLAQQHPVTGTVERFSLYDRFHQKNQKRPEEKLRSLNIIPALRKEVNSSVAEQFNRELASVRYSLCQMKESHFKQTVRVLMELHNEKINMQFKAEMEAMCNAQLSVGLSGMLGLQSQEGMKSHQTYTETSSIIQTERKVTSSFVAQQYSVDDSNKDKIRALLSGHRDVQQAIAQATRRFTVSIKDIASVCPRELLEESSLVMPWLTDDAVNYRVAQLAKDNMCASLGTFDYILWHREWTQHGSVSDETVHRIPFSNTLFLPRIVGHSSPETGNHFILWVFDFKSRQIRIYDSLSLHCSISENDMNLLRNVFRSSGGLQGWTVIFPPQWKQQDSVNCGVFVCTAVEKEVKHQDVMTESLTLNQCRTLRLHHATQMLRNVNAEDFPPTDQEIAAIKQKEIKLIGTDIRDTDSNIHCLAWKIKACLFQRATGKNTVFHQHIKKYQWVQCTACKNWLHFECAGVAGDLASKDFFCGCSTHVDYIPEAVNAEEILTDSEIKELEKKLQAGHVLSNRMYLWNHKGLDPALKQHYSEHITTFNDMTTEAIIQRLENVLSHPGTGCKDLQFITDVILPEALIQWLRRKNISRFEAEKLLLVRRPLTDNERDSGMKSSNGLDKENILWKDTVTAAAILKEMTFEGDVQLPSVLTMEKDEVTEIMEAVHTWEEDHDYHSPAEEFTFVFSKHKDYEKFCQHVIDVKNLKVFSRFEDK